MYVSEKSGTITDSVRQEALERQQQILLLAQQEAHTITRTHATIGKELVQQEFADKIRRLNTDRKIHKSALINCHKMVRIKTKFALCEKIFHDVELILKQFASEECSRQDYQLFLIASVTEGLVRMFQEKRDRQLMIGLIPHISRFYSEYMTAQVGQKYPLQLTIATNCVLIDRKLEEGPLSKNREDRFSIGGVILADQTGNITFKSTLDSRMNILKDLCLPDVREMIWNNAQKVANIQ